MAVKGKYEGANKPLVSVVMTSFNEKKEIIDKAILSILNQTYENFELLIFDDSTNVETKDAIDFYRHDPRVRVFRFSERLGFVKSLNRGLQEAKGDYIARMDGDDISLPIRFEKEVENLEKNKDVSVIGGQINIINEYGVTISFRKYPQDGIGLYLFSCVRNPMAHPSIMMRRGIVDRGYRYDETLKMSEDLDLWLRLMNDGNRVANISETVLNYRVTDSFLMKRSNRKQREYMEFVRKKNFCVNHLFHSVLSNTAGWLFLHTPASVINRIYSKENKQKRER